MSDKNIDWLKRLQILDKALEENGVRTNFCVDAFGKIGYRPDFSKHDKGFKDEIEDLRKELRESKDYITQLKHELEEKCSFETDRLVKLPFDPLETANMLLNATYMRKVNRIDRLRGCAEDTIETDMYSIDDLEQIAEHLLVYCKHNKEDEE